MNINFEMSQVHREELMREAQHERLIRQAQTNQREKNSVLNSLGRQMVKIGERLQGQS